MSSTRQRGSLAGAQVRVATHATCAKGYPSEHRGRRGVVLGTTASRQQWRVHMMDDGAVISLPRVMLEVLGPHSSEPTHDASDTDGRHMDARLAIASGQRIHAASAPRGYSDAWRLQSARAGADDHERHPSRMGGVRVWRDGRSEVVA